MYGSSIIAKDSPTEKRTWNAINLTAVEQMIILAALELYKSQPQNAGDKNVKACAARFEKMLRLSR